VAAPLPHPPRPLIFRPRSKRAGRHPAGVFAGSRTGAGTTKPFWIALIIGFLVQGYKGLAWYVTHRRWNLRRFVETGGMPSSHAAAVSALTTAVGLAQGFGSVLFGVTLYFSLVIMYDAAGLRRAAGRQAVILNRLLDEHFVHPEADTQRLMELLGHTPFEVAVGAVLGVASALLMERIF
jgi:acid phosphatase family membrane protein YuiD